MFKSALLLVALSIPLGPASAATCTQQAAEKHLAGAAKTSFLGKCEKDSAADCDAHAAEKNLHGAAKTSFVGKCVKDAVGQ